MNSYIQILITALASGGLWSFITFLVTRKDKSQQQLDAITKQLKHLERDACRTQILVLMSDYPNEKKELLTLAEKYFCELRGNFYMETIFKNWLAKNDISVPSWFKNR